MDLGSSICTPKKPACALCPLNEDCLSRARGDQETFPRKAPKKTGTLRRGAAFVVTRGDELLVRTRAEKGLLGGMTEVPGSDWLAGQDDKTALKQAPLIKGLVRWNRKVGVVTHVFTHFPLELVVYTTSVPARARASEGMRWVPISTLKGEALPNVMRKVIAHGWISSSLLKNPSPRRRLDDSLYDLESVEMIMRGRFTDQGGLFSYIAPDKRVPANHPLRKVTEELVRE